MALHENLKTAKVLEEILAYFLDRGHTKLDMSLEMLENQSMVTVTFKKDTELLTQFKKDMYCCRDQELEEYGWELGGELDCVCNLDHIGMMVDKYEIKEGTDTDSITLIRYK